MWFIFKTLEPTIEHYEHHYFDFKSVTTNKQTHYLQRGRIKNWRNVFGCRHATGEHRVGVEPAFRRASVLTDLSFRFSVRQCKNALCPIVVVMFRGT